MKKIIMIIILVAVITAPATSYGFGPFEKLGRGVANTVTGPVEIFYRTGKGEGITSGLGNMIRRLAAGVFEVFTFPMPNDVFFEKVDDYDAIITGPELFIQQGKN